MARTDIVDLLGQTRANLKQAKRERAAAMDAIVDMDLERAEMKHLLLELLETLEDQPVGAPLSMETIAAQIKAADYLRRV